MSVGTSGQLDPANLSHKVHGPEPMVERIGHLFKKRARRLLRQL